MRGFASTVASHHLAGSSPSLVPSGRFSLVSLAATTATSHTLTKSRAAGLGYSLGAMFILIGIFFVATGRVPRLHKWMLQTQSYSKTGRPLGNREFITKWAPTFGIVLILLGLGLALFGLLNT